MNKFSTRKTVFLAILIALEVIVTRLCSVNTPTMKIGFGFIVVAVTGLMYGPLCAGIQAGVSDVLGALIFPTGSYFFGFTLTAILTGIIYGLFLHNRKVSFAQICCVVIISYVCLSLCLNTYWLSILMHSPFSALLCTRLIQAAIMIPLQIIGISAISVPVKNVLEKQFSL